MTWTKKQKLPALHQSGKVKNPDMPEVEQQNYTSTVLKYANLALPFPQLETDAKRVVPAINELHKNRTIANPEEPADQDPLNTVQIAGTVYKIEGGGGGGDYTAGAGIYFTGDNNSVINADAGRFSPNLDQSEFYSYRSQDYQGNYNECWVDSGTTVDGHTVYQSYAGTYKMSPGISDCRITVGGYNSFTLYAKQNPESSGYRYLVFGEPNQAIDLTNGVYALNCKNATDSDYISYKYYTGGRCTVDLMYRSEIPASGASVDLNHGQFADTGTTVDGHTVYMSDVGSYHIDRGNSVCTLNFSGITSITVYFRASSEANYDWAYVGKLDADVSTANYQSRLSGNTAYEAVTYTCSGDSHSIQISYSKDGSVNGNDDRAYFYYVINEYAPTPTYEDRAYAYIVLGDPIEAKGEIFNDYGNNFALALYSHAEGQSTLSSGWGSHAEGYKTVAYGSDSHAEGSNNTAYGGYSHAEGQDNIAQSTSSHVEGARNVAAGQNAHAEGMDNETGEQCAHAEGTNTKALGAQSHAEGWGTLAKGPNSHAEGKETQALGWRSHAEGVESIASGDTSHAEGWETQAKGGQDHSEGHHTIAEGGQSHAEGFYTHSAGGNSHAEGFYTLTNGGSSHAEGYYTITSGRGSHAEGGYSIAQGTYSHAEGGYFSAGSNNIGTSAEGIASHTEGMLTRGIGLGAHAEGGPAIKYPKYEPTTVYHTGDIVYCFYKYSEDGTELRLYKAIADNFSNISPQDPSAYNYWDACDEDDLSFYLYDVYGAHGPFASGMGSHAEGLLTMAYSDGSHAEGYLSISSGMGSHAEGYGDSNTQVISSGKGSHAEGGFTQATADFAHAEGHLSIASGVGSHAEGYGVDINAVTRAIGLGSHAEGNQAKAEGIFSHAEGERSWAFGNASHAENSSVAYGYESHAEGSGTMAGADFTHTEGAGNQNIANFAHVEGAGNKNISLAGWSHTEGAGNTNYGMQSHLEGSGNTLSGMLAHVEGAGNQSHGEKTHTEGGGNTVYAYGSHIEGKHNTVMGVANHAEGRQNRIGPTADVNPFYYGQTYSVGDVVCVNAIYANTDEYNTSHVYRCITAPGQIQESSIVQIISPATWDASTTYPAGSIVKRVSNLFGDPQFVGYYRTYNESTGQDPLSYSSPWTRIVSFLSPFSATRVYSGSLYLLDVNSELPYHSGVVAKILQDGTIPAMWEPVATPIGSHIEGFGNSITGDYQHVQGKFNTADANKAFIIGNGTDGAHRSNALTVDWSGNTAIAGDLTTGITLNTTAQTIGAAINEISVRVPAPPTADGHYTLSLTITDGVPTYSWVSS